MQDLLDPADTGLSEIPGKKGHTKRLFALFSVVLASLILWRFFFHWMTPPDVYEIHRSSSHSWITQISEWRFRHFRSIPNKFMFQPTKDKVKNAAALLAHSNYYELTLEDFSDLTGIKDKLIIGSNKLFLIRSVKYNKSPKKSYAYCDSANNIYTLNRFSPAYLSKDLCVMNNPLIVELAQAPKEVYVAILGDDIFQWNSK